MTDVDDAELEAVTITISSSNVSSEDVLGFTALRLRFGSSSERRRICPVSEAMHWFSFVLK